MSIQWLIASLRCQLCMCEVWGVSCGGCGISAVMTSAIGCRTDTHRLGTSCNSDSIQPDEDTGSVRQSRVGSSLHCSLTRLATASSVWQDAGFEVIMPVAGPAPCHSPLPLPLATPPCHSSLPLLLATPPCYSPLPLPLSESWCLVHVTHC